MGMSSHTGGTHSGFAKRGILTQRSDQYDEVSLDRFEDMCCITTTWPVVKHPAEVVDGVLQDRHTGAVRLSVVLAETDVGDLT